MRYWFDTEFIENGKMIDLISIGIVSEDGREYYAINYDCDISKASQWVKENVLKKLPEKPLPQNYATAEQWHGSKIYAQGWRSRASIVSEIARFMSCEQVKKHTENLGPQYVPDFFEDWEWRLKAGMTKPEIWAYYADYDWVAFCQIFGTMMDLPDGFPMYCRDIKQECDRLGNPQLPEQGKGEHNALEDARWNKKAWEYLYQVTKKSV